MAKASARCICVECGEEFIRERTFFNRCELDTTPTGRYWGVEADMVHWKG